MSPIPRRLALILASAGIASCIGAWAADPTANATGDLSDLLPPPELAASSNSGSSAGGAAKGSAQGGVTEEIELEGMHAFGAKARHGGDAFGSFTETSSHFKYVAVPQISKDLFLRVGVEWDRFDFGTSNLHPNFGLPSTLESEALVLGADWKLSEQWLLRAEISPGFYGTSENLGMNSASVPVTVGGVYLQSPDLQWIVGMRIDPRSDYPVMPGAGVRWQFADQWTLDAVLPTPRIEYELNKKVEFFAGASVDGGTFRVNNGTGVGAGRPGLSSAMVSYTEVGMGGGVAWKFLPGFELDGSGGYLVYRDFDYFNSKADYKADPAPYIDLSVSAKF